MLSEFEVAKEELLEMLSFYHCYKNQLGDTYVQVY